MNNAGPLRPDLMKTLEVVTGGPDVRCVGIQPRVVPPEDEGGYTAWHRDMQDNQSGESSSG